MQSDLVSKYIWLVDLLTQYGRLSREQISRFWEQSYISNGKPLPERSFHHYRRAIESNLHIEIACDRNGQYYIEKSTSPQKNSFTRWMLDTYTVNTAFQDNMDASGYVEIEDVPSAREFFPRALDAIRKSQKIEFSYAGFSRSRVEQGIRFHPYYLKRYKQRWYMVGLREKSNDIRTYALDRVKEMVMIDEQYTRPDGLTADDLFGNIVGITMSQANPHTVRLKTTATQAKYLRALPLHHTQTEVVGDGYSIFSYRLKLNYELVHEILSFGDSVQVLEPQELRLMVVNELKSTLEKYNQKS